MTNEGKRENDTGPGRIPLRDGTGIQEPSREVSQADQSAPGTGTAGAANEELEWAKKHVHGRRAIRKPARSVFRKTELLGIAPPSEPDVIKKTRQRILKKIRDPDSDVLYRPFEDAFRDFVCSLVERQDRVYDEMLLHVADLQQQIDTLEDRPGTACRKTTGDAEVTG